MYDITKPPEILVFGNAGETPPVLEFDVSGWTDQHPSGKFFVRYTLPGDINSYFQEPDEAFVFDGLANTLTYTPSSATTTLPGNALLSIKYFSSLVGGINTVSVIPYSVGYASGFEDAPVDGETYGRKDADWAKVESEPGPAGPPGPDYAAGIVTYNGADLTTKFADAAAFHAAIVAEDFSNIHIGDYWPISLSGTYRDVGSYTCPAGAMLYTDTALTTEAGVAASALQAEWKDEAYCQVSSGGTKYCATSDCLAYYERTLSNAVMKLEVAAINPYWRYGDSGELTGAKNHVLFISRDCLPHYLRFRKASTAWHIAPDPTGGIGVWQGSALFATLNDPDYGVLPLVAATDIGAYIYGGASGGGMRYYGETRATEATATSTGAWLDRGKLFLPTEDEVWGREIFTIRNYHGHLHLPLFNGSRRHISKGIGDGGSRYDWWEMSAYAGNVSRICYVTAHGAPTGTGAVYGFGAPVCFLAV